MKQIILIGCGSLGTIIAEGIKGNLNEQYEIKAVCDARQDCAKKLAAHLQVPVVMSLNEITAMKPDYVVEAASKEVVEQMAPDILGAGINMIILSVGALADEELVKMINQAGKGTEAKLHVASGAVGGFDLMGAARFGGLAFSQIHTSKNPSSLNGAPGLGNEVLPEDEARIAFEGTSRDAIKCFPKNVNVSVSTALATLGIDGTQVKISSIPSAEFNTHEIYLDGEFGTIEIKVNVKPSKENPKSSALAAWSVLALLQKLSQTISI